MKTKTKFLCSDFWLDIFYPNRCPACERVIAWNEWLCRDCEDRLPYIATLPWQSVFPATINGSKPNFDYANSLFWYKDEARAAVLSLKYRNGINFAVYSAERLVMKLESDEIRDIDIITSVPMHKRKEVGRGYNQATVLAEEIARLMKIPTDFSLLAHRKSNKEQHGQSDRNERFSAAEESYYICGERTLDGKNVLICDDIFTTGATIDKCAELLKEMGAQRVYALTVCRTCEQCFE